MGTYTANKNLYMPSIGEQGWGTLMNGNLETIDNFLKPITVSGSTYTFTGNQTGGSISATNITNSGTLTNTGNITANGGIVGTTGTFSGAISCSSINVTGTKTVTVTPSSTTITFIGYSSGIMLILPYQYGIIYSGTLKGKVGSTAQPLVFNFMSSTGSVSSQSINGTIDTTITIPANTIYACVIGPNNAVYNGIIYLPNFS